MATKKSKPKRSRSTSKKTAAQPSLTELLRSPMPKTLPLAGFAAAVSPQRIVRRPLSRAAIEESLFTLNSRFTSECDALLSLGEIHGVVAQRATKAANVFSCSGMLPGNGNTRSARVDVCCQTLMALAEAAIIGYACLKGNFSDL